MTRRSDGSICISVVFKDENVFRRLEAEAIESMLKSEKSVMNISGLAADIVRMHYEAVDSMQETTSKRPKAAKRLGNRR